VPASSSCSQVDDAAARSAVTAARACSPEAGRAARRLVSAVRPSNRQAPVPAPGAYRRRPWDSILRGAVFSPDGSFAVRLSGTGTLTDAAALGSRLAAGAPCFRRRPIHILGEHG